MRILLIPRIGLKKAYADSNYILFLDLATHLVKNGHFCYMILPKFAREHVTRLPGLMYLFKEYNYDWYTENGFIDLKEMSENFSRVVGKYFVDAIVTAMPAQVPIYQLALSDAVRQRDLPCITIEPAVYYLRDNMVNRILHVMTHLGYANSSTVFLSPNEKAVALENARKCLAPSDVRKIEENSLVLPVGVPCDYIDTLTEDNEKYDKFTLFFGARFNNVKKPDKVIELFGKFLSSGKDVQIKMTTNTAQGKVGFLERVAKALQKYADVLDVTYQCPREEYLQIARRSHVAIAWSSDEGFPVGFWEQMYLGLPVLFVNRPWAVKQLPDWYPWVFSSTEEAYAMLLYIYENYEQVSKDMERMKDFIRENYSSGKIYEAVEAELERITNLPRAYMPMKSIKELIKQCFPLVQRLGKVITFDDMINIMSQVGNSFPKARSKRLGHPKFPRDYDIYRMMLSLGFQDTYKRAVPEFIVPDQLNE